MPLLSPAQRRIASWGVLLIALLLAFAGSALVLRRVIGGYGLGQQNAPVMSQDIVTQRLLQVAKLVASEMTMRDVVVYEQTQFRSTKRVLLVVTAKVSAGIDLSHDTRVEIDSATKRITVSIPPSAITGIDVVNITTYDERAGLWNPFRPSDRDEIQRRVRARILATAKESGLLAHADESAGKVLRDLLAQDGYTVEIRRPPVVARPPG